MNREIKFRGKTIQGEWVYGSLTILKKDDGRLEKGCYISNSVGMPFAYRVIPETVGQLIAVIRKDIELYEGDVLESPKGRKHRVVFWDNLPSLTYVNKGKIYFQPMTQGFLNNKKLIGNIHENKDLI